MTTDHTPDFASQLLLERLEEIDVSGYVRRGRHGMVRVGNYTRTGVGNAAFHAAWQSQAGMPHRKALRDVARSHREIPYPTNRGREASVRMFTDIHAAKHAGKGRGQSKLKKPGQILSAKYGAARDVVPEVGRAARYSAESRARKTGHLTGTAAGVVRDIPGRAFETGKARAHEFTHRGPDSGVGKSRKSGHLSGTGRRPLRDAPPRVLRGVKKVAPGFGKAVAGNMAAASLSRMPNGARIATIADLMIPKTTGHKRKAARLTRDLAVFYAHLQRGNVDDARIQAKRIREIYGISRIPKFKMPKRRKKTAPLTPEQRARILARQGLGRL